MRRIAVCDVGGTHTRFGIAATKALRATALSDPIVLQTGEYSSFNLAWEEFGRRLGSPLPRELAIAFAGPVGRDVLKLTNSPWTLCPARMREELGIVQLTIVNDFGAVAHAVPWLEEGDFRRVCGPARPLPKEGVITIVGPGTGLGVAALVRHSDGSYYVLETEGGHIDFAPLDPVEDHVLAKLRKSFGRVSVERLVSGRGLRTLYEALGAIENRPLAIHDERALWSAALNDSDTLAAAALKRFCLSFGAVAGDLALSQGAAAVVIAGGVGLRLADHLPVSGFRDRFIAKGRFERQMDEMPVKLIVNTHPGLLGAATAFLREHPQPE